MNQLRSLAKSVLDAFGVAQTKRNETILGSVALGIVGLFVVGALLANSARIDFSVADLVAQVVLSPASGQFAPGSTQTITLKADSGGLDIDGFQVFVHITGTIPSNLAFAATDHEADGLHVSTSAILDETGGKLFRFLSVTKDATVPYKTSSLITLGTFTFTTPASGQAVFTFDPSLTKIVQHTTSANVAIIPSASTYTFGTTTSSSSASSSTSSVSSSSSSVSSSSSASSSVSSSSSASSSSTSSAAVTADVKVSANGGAFSDGPITVNSGTNVTFQWTSTGASSCYATESSTGNAGTVGPSGSVNYTMTISSTYTLTCGGATDTVRVNVVVPVSSSSSTSTTTTSVSSSVSSSSSAATTCASGEYWNGSKCVTVACKADYDHSGVLDASDFLVFAQNYKKSGISCSLDIVGSNCMLDVYDFLVFAQNYKKPSLCI